MNHFKIKPVITEQAKVIKGSYHPIRDWKMDPNGYFLIRINKKEKMIELGHCTKENQIEVMIKGRTPQEVYFAATENNLLSRLDHAAYLGKELEKAYLALKYNLEYVQDSELEI